MTYLGYPSWVFKSYHVTKIHRKSMAAIWDEGIPHTTKTEDGGEDVGDFLNKLVPSLTICSCMWGASLGHEPDGFLDSQGWKVNVAFGRVLDVTTRHVVVTVGSMIGLRAPEDPR